MLSPSPPLSERDKDIIWLFYNKTGHLLGVVSYFSKYFNKHPQSIREVLGAGTTDKEDPLWI